MSDRDDCYLAREATVAHRFFSDPLWQAPAMPTLGQPALVPVSGGSRLYTWGKADGPPRQWWIRLSGTALQADVAGPININTLLDDADRLPHVVYTRAQIDLGNNLLLTQDWRGTVLTPPARSVTVRMLGLRDDMSARIDNGGELAAQGTDEAVTVESLTAFAWEASRDDGKRPDDARATPLVAERQSRGRTCVRVTDTYDTGLGNLSNSWMPLMPWAQRVRVWAHMISGPPGATIEAHLFAHTKFALSSTVVAWNPQVDDPPWVEATEAVGIRPVLTGGNWRLRVEQEVYT